MTHHYSPSPPRSSLLTAATAAFLSLLLAPCTATLTTTASPAPTAASAQGPTVSVLNGSYAGLHLPTYNQDIFLGIPYAQDTSGINRFRVPQYLNETWDDVRQATQYGDMCPDDVGPPVGAAYGMSEECLSLNVVRPTGEEGLLPVMVWIHGGSYQRGTTGLAHYNLTFIVQRSVEIGRPVLGVSINYRKGGWGNMYSVEIAGAGQTNLALRDMRQALGWLQENVQAFGGDPGSVTIWGESSGSFAVVSISCLPEGV
jgi:carboxylesterase type B